MRSCRDPKKSRNSWKLMEIHEYSWKLMKINENSWNFHGVPNDSAEWHPAATLAITWALGVAELSKWHKCKSGQPKFNMLNCGESKLPLTKGMVPYRLRKVLHFGTSH